MLCRKPLRGNGSELFGCGQCLPCRVNQRRQWQSRLMLEASSHPVSAFLTLTYRNECLPDGGLLRHSDVRNFLEKLRKRLGHRPRFFVCGEYGDTNWRPHYHLILFGLEPNQFDWSELWTKGFTYVGSAERGSLSYVSGYVTKKVTQWKSQGAFATHPWSQRGVLKPEYALGSRHPALGAAAVTSIAKSYLSAFRASPHVILPPTEIMMDGKVMPLDRWSRHEIARLIGVEYADAYGHLRSQAAQRVQAVLDRATVTSPPSPGMDPVVWRWRELTQPAYEASVKRRKIFQKTRPL